MAEFKIPAEFQDQLESRPNLDKRSDQEILDHIQRHVPVNSEKNIWCYWDKGISSLPSWCKRNVLNWVRICDPSWTVRLLDNVPGSKHYILDYIPKDMLPKCFLEGTIKAKFVGQLMSDMIKGPLLYLYGGVIMDVGCILFRDLDRGLWSELENPDTEYQVAVPMFDEQAMNNHFVVARKGNPLIQRWYQLFNHLWSNRTTCENLHKDSLVYFLSEPFCNSNVDWDFKVSVGEVLDYTIQNLCWARVCMLGPTPDDPFDGAAYQFAHVLRIDVFQEHKAAKSLLDGDKNFGPRLTDALAVSLDPEDSSRETYAEAYNLVWTLLAQTSMQKISRAAGLLNAPQPGSIFDARPNADSQPGTFGELLQYGAVHFRQIRESIKIKERRMPPVVLYKALLEP